MTRLNFKNIVSTLVLALCVSIPARATTITDLPNDFIPTFTGAHSGDLDVISTFATFDGVSFHIGATVNADVGTLATALYVFGFNRGAATSNFAAIGVPGVVFDSTITMTGTGVTGGRDLVSNAALTLPVGASHISGATFQIDVPLALLPSQGLTPLQYGINFWPRDASRVGNAQIADFAPDNGVFNASSVPEPNSALLVGVGIAGLLAIRHKIRAVARKSGTKETV